MRSFCYLQVLCILCLHTAWSQSDLSRYVVGCYADGAGSDHVLPFGSGQNYTTIGSCIAYCSTNTLTYAGLKAGRECWCGKVYPNKFGKSLNCNITCRDDPGRACGGLSELSVYTTCPSNTYGKNCALQCNCNLTHTCHYNGSCSYPPAVVLPSTQVVKPLPSTEPVVPVVVNCSVVEGGCEHQCVTTQHGDHCQCYDGYILMNVTHCNKDSRETYYFYASLLGNAVLLVILAVVVACCAHRGRRIRRLKVIVHGRKTSADTSTLKKKTELGEDLPPTHRVQVAKVTSNGQTNLKNGSPLGTRSLGRPNRITGQTQQIAPNVGRQQAGGDINPNITRKLTNAMPPLNGWDASPDSYDYVAMKSGNFTKPANRNFDHAVTSPDFVQYQSTTYDDATSGRKGVALPPIPVSDSDFFGGFSYPEVTMNGTYQPTTPYIQPDRSYYVQQNSRDDDDYNDAASKPDTIDEFYLQVIESPNLFP